MTWEELLQLSATLLNDSSQEEYTNAVLLPFLNMTLSELQEVFELNNIPITNETSPVIEVDAGVSSIGFPPDPPVVGTPYLPSNLVEIQRLWQSNRGQNTWTPLTKRDYLTADELSNNTEVGYFSVWAWMNQEIRLLPANIDLDLKIDLIQSMFTFLEAADLTNDITVVNISSVVQYRVAGLAAEFITENPARANALNANASAALDRTLGISTKGRQSIMTRRRPFRASWKRRGILI